MALTGFEDITHELSPQEVKIAKFLATEFFPNEAIGYKNAKTNKEIEMKICLVAARYSIELKHKYTSVRIRKIINYIRINGLCNCLLATSNGYYMTNDKNEIDKYLDSLRQRIQSIEAVYDSIENQKRNIQ